MFPNPLEYFNETYLTILSRVFKYLAYAMPFILVGLGWKMWVRHRNADWLSTLTWVMLEIKIPRDVYKTPLAMEMALGNALSQAGGVGTNLKKYWQGRVIVWFSLEIVSTEGEIHFYIRTPIQFRNIIESQLYAQYPQAEIFTVDDYALKAIASMHEEEWDLWGCEQHLKKPDPYPIKTYVDYGLDKATTKIEEEAGLIDPITGVLEWMGSMKKDEHVWVQIMVRSSKNSHDKPGAFFGQKEDWKDKAKREIDGIKAKYEGGADALEALGKKMKMTKLEQETITAIERSLDKPAFDTGIRTIYLAKKNAYRGENVNGIVGLFRPYSSNNLNGFKIAHETDFDNPWQDFSGNKKVALKKHMLEEYLERAYFYPPDSHHFFTLTAEEIATIYHFPGRVSTTPTFKRIESKKSEPPVNLPM